MVRALDTAELLAIQAGTIVARDFVWLTAKDRISGAPTSYGFWSDVGTVTADVLDAVSQTVVNRTFVGSDPNLNVGNIELVTDLSIRTVDVELNPFADTVQTALRTKDPRGGEIQIYRGYFDSAMAQLASAKPRFVGFVDEAPISTGPEDADSYARLVCVSKIRELTRSNPAVRSHEDQLSRDATDDFFIDCGVAADWEIFWGTTPEQQLSRREQRRADRQARREARRARRRR